MHICISKLNIIGSDNGLSPGRRQAIIWTNAGILLIEPLGTNFSEILIAIAIFSFKKKHLKMSSGKCRPFCLGLNVLSLLSCTGNNISVQHPDMSDKFFRGCLTKIFILRNEYTAQNVYVTKCPVKIIVCVIIRAYMDGMCHMSTSISTQLCIFFLNENGLIFTDTVR